MCNVYDKKLESLGVETDMWISLSFKVDDILYIREDVLDTGDTNEFGCIVMLKNDGSEWAIDAPYQVMLKVWENTR